MTFGTVVARRLLAGSMSAVIVASFISFAAPGASSASSHSPELLATLELPGGDIEYELEPGRLYLLDEEDAPFVVQVIDGCAINDHMWLYGAGLSGIPLPLRMLDLRSGESERVLLPAHEPGVPIGSVVEPEALAICPDEPIGGLPKVHGTAMFTAAGGRGGDYSVPVTVHSDGRDDRYRRISFEGSSFPIISKRSPIVAVDDDGGYDVVMLLAEGRTPRHIEGVVFTGPEGMAPSRAKLDRALKDITNARVRRAFETARKDRVPRGIIEDLRLSRVDDVHHLGLEFDSLGADAYLAEAGWIRVKGDPIAPPRPVDERFRVELARADGEIRQLPLVGPLVGSASEGALWVYRDEDALVQIIDGCELSGSFWTVAAAVTDEPLELSVTDSTSATTATHLLWTDREAVSRLSDASSLPTCP